tara:strand:- start:497 stop:1132 length:636 start_codon:yes stop_codon:yes gene_type:complete
MNTMTNEDVRITSIRPTNPGFLLIQFSDGTARTIEISEAPLEDAVNDISPICEGASKERCPHCEGRLKDQYRYVFFSKIIKGKVYSFNSREWNEEVVAQICSNCLVNIFEWEKNELYLEYRSVDKRRKGLTGTLRLEPMTLTPGNCPGHRKVAWLDKEAELFCETYPRCLKTRECKEDWRILVDNSKIRLSNLLKTSNANKFFDKYEKYDV